MRIQPWLLGLLSGGLVLACSGTKDMPSEKSSLTSPTMSADDDEEGDDEDEDDEQEIDLASVPAAVKQAALAAVPGLKLTGAEKETEHGKLVYCLEGTADGEAVEVEVSASGDVLEIEHEDGEDD
jgi:uncharacterized membrane protein YkoI